MHLVYIYVKEIIRTRSMHIPILFLFLFFKKKTGNAHIYFILKLLEDHPTFCLNRREHYVIKHQLFLMFSLSLRIQLRIAKKCE
jgi:hypothetical protein